MYKPNDLLRCHLFCCLYLYITGNGRRRTVGASRRQRRHVQRLLAADFQREPGCGEEEAGGGEGELQTVQRGGVPKKFSRSR